MTDLLAARAQMATSLAFHIVFAALGIALPALMTVAEWRGLRTGDPGYRQLGRRWAKGTAILFAVGAVSGTVLSFELGLLWPTFMARAGAIVGLPFALEGFAFFTEAIFLGIYLYGWERVPPRVHVAAGAVVAVSGMLSGIFVVLVNAWMNAPVGFTLGADGTLLDIDPLRGLTSPAALAQTLHMTLAAYAATGMAVAGVHALLLILLRRRATRADPTAVAFHRRALTVALLVGAPATLLQPLSGHYSAAVVARTQPVKLAALEGQWATERGAPLRVGGWPDEVNETTRWAIEVPRGLSLLAFDDPNAEVRGLADVPRADRPPVAVVHVAFQLMVALGTLAALVALWAVWAMARHRWTRRVAPRVSDRPRLLAALAVVAPTGFVAIEAGWTVTEVGRQPWVVQGVLRTADAVTPMPGLAVPFVAFTLLYVFLGVVVAWLLWRQIVRTSAS